MFWLKVILDWGSTGCSCRQCGGIASSGGLVYLLIDADMKIVDIRCSNCFRSSFPEGL